MQSRSRNRLPLRDKVKRQARAGWLQPALVQRT
jgi:hypothetical protein